MSKRGPRLRGDDFFRTSLDEHHLGDAQALGVVDAHHAAVDARHVAVELERQPARIELALVRGDRLQLGADQALVVPLYAPADQIAAWNGTGTGRVMVGP